MTPCDSQRYSFGASKLTSDEARRIGNAISAFPNMSQRQGFYPRGGGPRWRADRPYHVALEDMYIREHWHEIDALCRLNSLPFNATGEVIQNEGVWRVHEFTWQMDAILFWDPSRAAGCVVRSFIIPKTNRFAVLETSAKLAKV